MNLERILKGLTNVMLGIAETILGLRFLLKLLGANSSNDFVSWIYDMSMPILGPFRNVFPTERLEDGFVIDFSTLFAMIIYGLVAMLIFYLIELLTPDPEPVVVEEKETKKRRA